MFSRSLKLSIGSLCSLTLAGILFAIPSSGVQAQTKPDPSKIPPKVMAALKAKFPKAEIQLWTREEEAGAAIHDIEFTQDGKKFEADIRDDGSIHNWERQIPLKELPAIVRKAVDSRYPKALIKEVMFITAVKDGKDVPEGYEILLETAGKQEVEVTVAPDGKFLEDPGEKK